jgi:polar amino acid transport system substrate-binding protein
VIQIKKLMIIIYIVFFISIFSKENIEIKIAEYPPYMIKGGKGMLVEMIYEIYRESEFEIVIKEIPRKRIEVEFLDEKTFYILGSAKSLESIPKEKINMIDYRKIIDTRLTVYYNKKYKSIKFKSISDLKGLKAGVILGSPLMAFYEKNGIITETADVRSNYMKLNSGRVDIVPGIDLTAKMIIEELFPSNKNNLIEIEKELMILDLGIFFHKKNRLYTRTLKAFEKGLKKIKENGKYIEIAEKYYGKGKVPKIITDFTLE